MQERLGPEGRVQSEASSLGHHNRDLWILVIFAAAVLVLGALSFLVPGSFWNQNALELRIPPQIFFLVMMVFMVVLLLSVRREMETHRMRLAALQQAFVAKSEHSASLVDPLTNVFNRNILRELLQGEVARTERNNRPLSLLMCDINNFKHVNDQYGHLMGDYVLAQVAGIIRACVRGSDYVVRFGGDEFLIILTETDEAGARTVRDRIIARVADWDRANHLADVPLSVSLGVYQHKPGQPFEQSVAEADLRMYSAKLASQGIRPNINNVPTSHL